MKKQLTPKKIMIIAISLLLIVGLSLVLFFRYKTYTFQEIIGANDTRVLSVIIQKPVRDSGDLFEMSSELIEFNTGNEAIGTEIEEVLSEASFRISNESNFFDEEGQMVFSIHNSEENSDNILLLSRNGLMNITGDKFRYSIAEVDLEKIVALLNK